MIHHGKVELSANPENKFCKETAQLTNQLYKHYILARQF